MGKCLVIAEKPSVAADIAKALGGFTKEKDYFESEGYIITSAVGHLITIAAPDSVEVKRGKWSLANLPVIPPAFDLVPIERTVERLKLVQKFIKRADITEIINACDAGREGELIFTYIMQYAGNKKPVRRLWLQSMTATAIRTSFKELRPEVQMRGLRDAAICRSEADWLIGINGTRAMTAFNSKGGGFFLTTVGRVQTPTLTLVAEREAAIRKFVPKDFWRIRADFSTQDGQYAAYWFDEKFEKKIEKSDKSADKNTDDKHERADRLWDEKRALAIMQACQKNRHAIVVEDVAKKQTQLSPALYDLTSLQREANGRFGFSAKTTLSIAQALYEKHKAITYPRTDARALPEDFIPTVQSTMEQLPATYAPLAKKVLKNGWVVPNKRIFNNEKISDHFAIVPTTNAPDKLSEVEEKVYRMIVQRFLAVFYPAAEYMVTTRISRINDEPFRCEGKVLVASGWLEVYGKEVADTEGNLPKIADGEKVGLEKLSIEAEKTRPPARFNEATLLAAMEGAGKLVDDEELKAVMKDKGLGTPATRATIIEGLMDEKYIYREGRDLVATAKAFSLMNLLKGLEVEELTSAELTGQWEQQLALMERGETTRESFMRGITTMTKHIVEQAKRHENDTLQGDYVTLSCACPKCAGPIQENYRRYQCMKCEFSVNKIIAGRIMAVEEVEAMIRDGISPELEGFRSKMGRPFNARLKLENGVASFQFDGGLPSGEVAWVSDDTIGPCPKCGARVRMSEKAYACEKSSVKEGEEKICDFRLSRVLLKREIEPEQASKLLKNGRTDLIDKLISKKGRPFSSFLILNEGGQLGFEFENKGEKTPKEAKAQKAQGVKVTKTIKKTPAKVEKAPTPDTLDKPKKATTRKTL